MNVFRGPAFSTRLTFFFTLPAPFLVFMTYNAMARAVNCAREPKKKLPDEQSGLLALQHSNLVQLSWMQLKLGSGAIY